MKNPSTAYHRHRDHSGMPADVGSLDQTPRVFAPREPLALVPEALGGAYGQGAGVGVVTSDTVIVVPIRGPIMQHDDWWWDSYEGIKSRVTAALEASPRAVVLSISSPGGLVSGCFEVAAEIRELADIAGVPLHAYVDGQATSAAYALACVADSITCPEAGMVGSIGVIGGIVDVTALDKAMGVRFEILSSGARKADGHPHRAVTDEAIAAVQRRINDLAAVFWQHVATHRGLSVDAVKGQQAEVFTGAAGKLLGLVDRVGTLDSLIKAIGEGAVIEGPRAQTNTADAAGRNEQTMKTLLKALGLSDTASEAEALTALQGREGATQRLIALSGKSTAAEAEGVFSAWRIGAEKNAETEARLAALAKTQADEKAKSLIEAACEDGRLAPANRSVAEAQYAAHGIPALEALLSCLPKSPIASPAPASKPAPGAALAALTDDEREVAKSLGLTPEQALENKKLANGGAV